MSRRKDMINMTPTRLDECAEQAISDYSEWLNAWHKANDEIDMAVTRADYDLWDDAPEVLLDQELQGSYGYMESRIIVIRVSPYHDEGGPTILTAFFDRIYTDDPWELDSIVQEFDTLRQMIKADGKLVALPEDKGWAVRDSDA